MLKFQLLSILDEIKTPINSVSFPEQETKCSKDE